MIQNGDNFEYLQLQWSVHEGDVDGFITTLIWMQKIFKPNVVQIPFDILVTLLSAYFNHWYLVGWVAAPVLPTILIEVLYLIFPGWDFPDVIIVHE